MTKFLYKDINYEIQTFEDIDLEGLCLKQGVEILNKNEIYENPVSFTEYRILDKWAYEMIFTKIDSYECDIIIIEDKQDPNLIYDVMFENRKRPIGEIL